MKKNTFPFLVLLGLIFLVSCSTHKNSEVDARVEKLLSSMTIEEKVGQMAQITLDAIGNGDDVFTSKIPFGINKERLRKAIVDYKVGSVLNSTNNYALTLEEWNQIIAEIQAESQQTRLKIPVVYGIDAIHGSTYAAGAVMFPQEIALAATFNPAHAYNTAAVSAYETKACGITWNFSPVLDLGSDPRFSRQFEGFGEDPYLGSIMGAAMIHGYEGVTDSVNAKNKLGACAKHFLGYSVPFSGKDRTPAYIPENVLREYHLPPFKAAVDAGVESFMINSGLINGVSVHASYDIITKLLKEELGFEGVVVSDWMDIINLQNRDKIASNNKEAVKLAINAGIDMSMVPYDYVSFCDDLVALVKDGEVKESRIDDAVRRILKMKIKMGLFEKNTFNYKEYPEFASQSHKTMSYNAAAEAITLLKNQDNVLPLKKDIRVLVAGPNANSMRTLNGGWTYSWQGDKTDRYTEDCNTILEAIQTKIGDKNVNYIPGVSYVEDGRYFEEKEDRYKDAVNAAKGVDAIVLCLGENSYTEKPGDLNNLNLSELQLNLAKDLAKSGNPVVLVLNEGRPRCFSSVEPAMKGIIQVYLPGNYGGDALADIIFGDVNPSGKLPYTYPAYPNSIVNYYHKLSEEQKPSEGAYKYESDYNPQYEFGYGLSYTTFEYKNLTLSSAVLSDKDPVKIKVDVKNTGSRSGKETVMLYSSDVVASISPDIKRLRGFSKIELQPGESKTIEFELNAKDLAFVNTKNELVTEPGDFKIQVGNQVVTLTYKK